MIHIEKSIQVDVPLRAAYRQWGRFADFLLFFTDGVKEVHQLDDRTMQWHADLGGTDVEWTGEIAFQRAPSAHHFGSHAGANAGSVTFQALDQHRCRITSRLDIDPEGFSEAAGASPCHVITQVVGDLRRFKEFLEVSARDSKDTRNAARH